MSIRSLIVGAVLLLTWCLPCAAFRRVVVGDTLPPFTLADRDGRIVSSDSLWKQITILVAVDTVDVFTSKVLTDIVRLSEEFPSGTLAVRIVVESKVHDGIFPKIPSQLRDRILFDPSCTMDSLFGFVVMPSTGVFTRAGQLLAYIPLWRPTYRDDLVRCTRRSLATKDADSLRVIWQEESRHSDILQQVRTLAGQGHRDSSEIVLSKQVAADTSWLEGLLQLGQMKLDQGDYAGAYRTFGRARTSFPPSSEVLLGLARAAVGLKEMDSALVALRLGRSLSGRPEEFLELEGEILYQQYDLDGAIARWRQAIESLMGIPRETE